MAKKVKFPLDMGNDVYVRTLEQLKENYNSEKVTEYFLDGRLLTWLKDRYFDNEAQKVRELAEQGDKNNLAAKLGKIFGIEIEAEDVNIDALEIKREKLDKLRKITSDDDILEHPQLVAFSQEELDELAKTEEKIYLCGEKFYIDKEIENRTYIGIGDKPMIDFYGEIDLSNLESDSNSFSFGSIKIVNSNFSEKVTFNLYKSIAKIEINGDEDDNKIVSIVHEAYGFKSLFTKIYK